MKRFRVMIKLIRRLLLGLAMLFFAISVMQGWTFGTPMTAEMPVDYQAIASSNGTFYYVDHHPLAGDRTPHKWRVELPSQELFGWFNWGTLGFRYISRIYPVDMTAAANLRSPTGQVLPAQSAFAIAIPHWFIIALLGAPDIVLLWRWLRSRAVADIATAEVVPAGTILEIDLPCVHCSYNLKMQPSNARCPECGAQIDDTLTLNKELEKSRPGWLRRLAVGNALLAIVHVLLILMWAAAFYEDRRTVAVIALISCGVYFFGIWLFTTPEHPHLRSVGGSRALFQRFASILILILVGAGIWLQMNWRSIPMMATMRGAGYFAGWQSVSLIAWVMAWLVFAVGTAFEYAFLAILAGRLLDRFMTEHCRIAGLGAGITSVLIIPIAPAIIRNRYIVDSSFMFVAVLLVSVAWMLFVVWTGVMNLYCAARFLAQSWRAQKRWQQTSAALAA